jgi:hypothetical protein
MLSRIRMLSLAVVAVLLAAAPSLAIISKPALEGAVNGAAPPVPEPSAALLFAAGAGLVHWTLRRRSRR